MLWRRTIPLFSVMALLAFMASAVSADDCTRASGQVVVVAGSSILDGETVTIADPITTAVFEFDFSNGTSPGSLPVPVSASSTPGNVRDALLSAVTMSGLAVSAAGSSSDTILLEQSASGPVGNIPILEMVADPGFNVTGFSGGSCPQPPPCTQATGEITVVPGSDLVDGENVTIADPFLSVTFEFDISGGISPGNSPVPVSAGHNASEVRDALLAAITTSPLSVIATASTSPDRIELTQATAGPSGNIPMLEGVSDPDFSVRGFSGGACPGTGDRIPLFPLLPGIGAASLLVLLARRRVDRDSPCVSLSEGGMAIEAGRGRPSKVLSGGSLKAGSRACIRVSQE